MLHRLSYRVISIFTLILFYGCGQTEVTEVNPSKIAEKPSNKETTCAATPERPFVKLDASLSFTVSPRDGKGPYQWRRGKSTYERDVSGGLVIASEVNPIVPLFFRGRNLGKLLEFSVGYGLTEHLAHKEITYLKQFPGRMTENLQIIDSAGQAFNCQLNTQLVP